MNSSTSLLTNDHQKHASIPNNGIFSWIYPASGDTWNTDITTCLNMIAKTVILSCLNLDMYGVL